MNNNLIPVSQMTNKQLKDSLLYLASIVGDGNAIGTNEWSRARICALLRMAVRRISSGGELAESEREHQ